MIRSKGWGIIGLLPITVAIWIFQMGATYGFQHRGDGPQTGAGFAIIGTGIWLLGRRLNQGSNSLRNARHSLFLIPLQFYGVPLFAAGSFMAIATLLAPP